MCNSLNLGNALEHDQAGDANSSKGFQDRGGKVTYSCLSPENSRRCRAEDVAALQREYRGLVFPNFDFAK